MYLPSPSVTDRMRHKTNILSVAGLNAEFFISKTSYQTKAKVSNLPNKFTKKINSPEWWKYESYSKSNEYF